MNQQQVLQLMAGGLPAERATALVKQRGIDFVPTDDYLETLRVAGADETLIAAVRDAANAIPGKLQLSTAPNAEVYLDGALVGKADSGGSLTLDKVKSGAHAVRVTAANKKPFEQSVNVPAGATSKLSASLAGMPGKIVVNSPAGAEVFLDNTSRGKADASGTLVIEGTAPGSYALRVTAPGLEDYQDHVTVSAGQPASVRAFGNPKPGTLQVRATPGARVFIDQFYPGMVYSDGTADFNLSAGAHSVRVSTEGQADFQRTVTIASAQAMTLDAPRKELSKPSGANRIEGLYATTDGHYLEFYADGTVMYGSQADLAAIAAALQQGKPGAKRFVYSLRGSTVRWSFNDPFGPPIDYVAKLRGNVMVQDWTAGTRHGEDTYSRVDAGRARH
jgi:hypothetical protein